MTNRYEDTTPFERDVMTSMGYHWKERAGKKHQIMARLWLLPDGPGISRQTAAG